MNTSCDKRRLSLRVLELCGIFFPGHTHVWPIEICPVELILWKHHFVYSQGFSSKSNSVYLKPNKHTECFSDQLLLCITATNANLQPFAGSRIMYPVTSMLEIVSCLFWHPQIYKLKHNSNTAILTPFPHSYITNYSIICNLWLFFLTPAVSHVQQCEVITQDLTNDVLVFVWMYWSVLYLGRYLFLFRMAGLQAATLSLSLMPCLLFFASLAFLTAPLYWINSSCHSPCWQNNSNPTYSNTGKVG